MSDSRIGREQRWRLVQDREEREGRIRAKEGRRCRVGRRRGWDRIGQGRTGRAGRKKKGGGGRVRKDAE